MSRRLGLAAALLIAAPAQPLVAQVASGAPAPAAAETVTVPMTDSAALATAHRYLDWFWAAEADSLWTHMGEGFRSMLRDPNNVADQIFGFVRQFGTETELLSEKLERTDDRFTYVRRVRLEAAETPWILTWLYEADGTIVNVDLNPEG